MGDQELGVMYIGMRCHYDTQVDKLVNSLMDVIGA